MHYYRLPPGLRLQAELRWLVSSPAFRWQEAFELAAQARLQRRLTCAAHCLVDHYGPLDEDAERMLADVDATVAIALLRATRGGSGKLLRGVLEPLLDDRGLVEWSRDFVRFWREKLQGLD